MQCVGEWKEGTTRYLVVRAVDGRKKIGSDKFKCLAYNMPGVSSSSGAEHDDMGPSVLMMRRRGVAGAGAGAGSSYASTTVTDDGLSDEHDGLIDLAADVEMSISDGATCNGLISASEGAQILRLIRGE